MDVRKATENGPQGLKFFEPQKILLQALLNALNSQHFIYVNFRNSRNVHIKFFYSLLCFFFLIHSHTEIVHASFRTF